MYEQHYLEGTVPETWPSHIKGADLEVVESKGMSVPLTSNDIGSGDETVCKDKENDAEDGNAAPSPQASKEPHNKRKTKSSTNAGTGGKQGMQGPGASKPKMPKVPSGLRAPRK